MPRPRKDIIDLNRTPYYHCIQRCVRRSRLCGVDPESGKNYTHRKDLILSKMKYLGQQFAIDICAYSIMDNHYHLIVKIDRQAALQLTEQQVVERWQKICIGDDINVQHYLTGEYTAAEGAVAQLIIAQWRERLYSISWYMKGVNEFLANLANAEDQCTGAFWEQRFKSKALLDEQALLCCMAYVDLNPTRSGQAATLVDSQYTSLRERILAYERSTQAHQDSKAAQPKVRAKNTALNIDNPLAKPHFDQNTQPVSLLPFTFNNYGQGQITEPSSDKVLPFDLQDYFDLVEWTKQNIHAKHKKQQKSSAPSILNHMSFHSEHWLDLQRYQECKFGDFVAPDKNVLKNHAAKLNNCWLKGSG